MTDTVTDLAPQPGDTFIELRDGVPWIGTQPEVRAAAEPDDVTDLLTAEVTGAFDPKEVRDPHTGKWIRDPNGHFLDEAAKELGYQQKISFSGHSIDRTKTGFTVKLKSGEKQSYSHAGDAAEAARRGRHLNSAELKFGDGHLPGAESKPEPGGHKVGDIVHWTDGDGPQTGEIRSIDGGDAKVYREYRHGTVTRPLTSLKPGPHPEGLGGPERKPPVSDQAKPVRIPDLPAGFTAEQGEPGKYGKPDVLIRNAQGVQVARLAYVDILHGPGRLKGQERGYREKGYAYHITDPAVLDALKQRHDDALKRGNNYVPKTKIEPGSARPLGEAARQGLNAHDQWRKGLNLEGEPKAEPKPEAPKVEAPKVGTAEFSSHWAVKAHLKEQGLTDEQAQQAISHAQGDGGEFEGHGVKITYKPPSRGAAELYTVTRSVNPEPPKTTGGGKITWTADGSNYHQGTDSAGNKYVLKYAPPGWDVHEQPKNAAHGRVLGPKIGHGKNAGEAKQIAQDHAAGGKPKTEVPPKAPARTALPKEDPALSLSALGPVGSSSGSRMSSPLERFLAQEHKDAGGSGKGFNVVTADRGEPNTVANLTMYGRVPPEIRRTLARKGAEFYFGDRGVSQLDHLSDLDSKRPSGYSKDQTFRKVAAAVSYRDNGNGHHHAVVAIGGGARTYGSGSVNVSAHESAHALDFSSAQLSMSYEFARIHAKIGATFKLTPYYVQASNPEQGRREFFAETFAAWTESRHKPKDQRAVDIMNAVGASTTRHNVGGYGSPQSSADQISMGNQLGDYYDQLYKTIQAVEGGTIK